MTIQGSIQRLLTTGVLVCISSMLGVASVWAQPLPNCLDNQGQVLPVNNAEVMTWKASSKNQYTNRAHVLGTLVKMYPEQTNHTHFEIYIGTGSVNSQGTLEIIYNNEFGALPTLSPGAQVEACGDFINSNAPAGGYQASPDGALVHWIHMNPDGNAHPDGYLDINGDVCGQDNPSYTSSRGPTQGTQGKRYGSKSRPNE